MKRSLFVITIVSTVLIILLNPSNRVTSGDLERILEEAETISDPYKRATALVNASEKYRKAGEKERASEIIDESLEAAEKIKLSAYKAIIFIKVGEKRAAAGQGEESSLILSRALDIVQGFDEGRYKDSFIARIAVAYADAGKKERAIALANRINDPARKDETLKEISEEKRSRREAKEKRPEPEGKVMKTVKSGETKKSMNAAEPVERRSFTAPDISLKKEEPSFARDIEAKEPAVTVAKRRTEEITFEEEEGRVSLERYRAVWISAGGKNVTPSFSAGLRVNLIGFEFGFRSSKRSLGGNYGADVLVFLNPYNRLSLFGGTGVYIEDNSENEKVTFSVGIQAFLSKNFVFGIGYHDSRGFNGTLGIQF